MIDPTLVVDTWESGGEIDEALLLSQGIKAIIIRLNNISGGHHMDANFANQWSQAANMIRIPYFVYNPWASGQSNYDWLLSHTPPEHKAVMLDIEVVYSGYPPSVYAAEVDKFVNLVRDRWNFMIYTGQWFLPHLSYWPDHIYWWAQYPYVLYPASVETWTWQKVRDTLATLSGPSNEGSCPGTVKMWQCSGDRLILPGCSKPMDVNVYFGSYAELADWAGGAPPPIPPVIPPEGLLVAPGIMLYRVERFGCPVFVHVIDPKIADVWVTGISDKFHQAKQTAAKYTSSVVVTNGGGWPYGGSWPNEIWKSKGTLLKASALDGRPWVGFTNTGGVVFGFAAPNNEITDAVGYDRFLGVDGLFNERYRNDTVKDSRTFSGATADGKFVLCVAEGNDVRNYGLTFLEEWEVLHEFGVITGGNHDGGSSSQVVDKAISDVNLIRSSDPTDAYVINAIVAGSESTITYLDPPELWSLKNVLAWAGEDQNDTDQKGMGFGPTIGGQSGMTNWKQIGSPEMALVQRLNTDLDAFTWERKRQWLVKDRVGFMYQSLGVDVNVPPWYDWNIVMGSGAEGSEARRNYVKVLARSSNGFVMIDGLDRATDYGAINMRDHKWAIQRINVTNSLGITYDTPVGVCYRPIWKPGAFRHAAGDIIGTGLWLEARCLDQKVSEEPPVAGEFKIKVLGVPKYYNGVQTFNPLNVRYEPNFGAIGESNTIGFFFRGALLTAYQELVDTATGDIWYLVNKDPAWMCAYQKSKNIWYIQKVI